LSAIGIFLVHLIGLKFVPLVHDTSPAQARRTGIHDGNVVRAIQVDKLRGIADDPQLRL